MGQGTVVVAQLEAGVGPELQDGSWGEVVGEVGVDRHYLVINLWKKCGVFSNTLVAFTATTVLIAGVLKYEKTKRNV